MRTILATSPHVVSLVDTCLIETMTWSNGGVCNRYSFPLFIYVYLDLYHSYELYCDVAFTFISIQYCVLFYLD
jgi:hypothetical protein